MHILYYSWNEHTYNDMLDTLTSLGHQVSTIRYTLSNYFNDSSFEEQFSEILDQTSFSFLYSFNFFPILSKIAQNHHIPYVCWVYDCPHPTLYAKELTNECNYIFHFDKMMVEYYKKLGAKHIYHLPLAVHTGRLANQLQIHPSMNLAEFSNLTYEHEVSFVGSLYEHCIYNGLYYLPESTKGFLDGAIAAQKQVWGCNIIMPILNKQIQNEFFDFIKFTKELNYDYPQKDLMSNLLLAKVTSDERIEYLQKLSTLYSCSIFSESNVNELCPSAHNGGYISYLDTMPNVFRHSKINLNITLRSITSGIPLRCIDILGSGGFLLSNVQPELCEYFDENIDFVSYHSLPEMLELSKYYLTHDSERKKIAHNGYLHACEQFSYEKQVATLLSLLPVSS